MKIKKSWKILGGWINLLSSIAESGLFTTADNIEAAKKAKAYNILIYASQRKDYSIAEYEAFKIK